MAAVETGVAGGVSFALTDEQRELRALAREFAEKEIRPKAAEYDEHQTHPADIIAKAHEVGLMNMHIPEESAAPACPVSPACSSARSCTWGCSGIAVSIVANMLGAGPVLVGGTDEQKRQWLAPLVDEPALCSFGAHRARRRLGCRRGIQTTAERRGDEYVLNGSKMFITNAGHAAWSVCLRLDRQDAGPSRPVRLRRAHGRRGREARAAPRQDGPARHRHVGVRPQRRRRSRRPTGSARRATASRSPCRPST